MSLNDEEIVGTEELLSDGTDTIFTGVTVVSTTSSTKVVVLSGVDLFREPAQLEEYDVATLSGTSPDEDGDYTVDEVLTLTSFSVKEAIGDSTGGTCTAKYPSGARKVGFDPTGLTNITETNVQDALEELDSAVSGGGLTASSHRTLDQLVHEIAENSYEEYVYSGNKVSSIVVWTNSSKTTKIREELFTYTGNQVTKIETKQYDGSGTLITGESMTEDLNYTGSKLDDIDRAVT